MKETWKLAGLICSSPRPSELQICRLVQLRIRSWLRTIYPYSFCDKLKGDNLKHNKSMYAQFGAGMCGPADWTNFDISPTLRLQRLPVVGSLFKSFGPRFPSSVRYGDIIRGLPLAEHSCDAIYCSHVLEHLALHDFRLALKNTYRYLKPGGRFRFVLPDLEQLAQDYVKSSDMDAAMVFMKNSCLGHQSRSKGFSGLLRAWLGNTAHLWMWDYKSIESELVSAGFTGIRRAQFGDSGDSRFNAVEDRGLWEHCLGVDCIKPKNVTI